MAKTQMEDINEESLLRQICGEDEKAYNCLTNHLYENPATAISVEDIETLIEEADKSGKFGPALDKAIFEASQNPGERERYTKIVQTLGMKSTLAIEQEIKKAEEDNLTDRAALLEKRMENQKLLNERTEDLLRIAEKFYTERLEVGKADGIRDERVRERNMTERQEMRKEDQGRTERNVRLREIKAMKRKERKIALKQFKVEESAAEAAKEARLKEKGKSDAEEIILAEQEETAREERKKERS